MTTLQQRRAELDAELTKTKEAQAFFEFFKKHPEIRAVQANEHLLREYHHGEEISLTSLEESAAYLGKSLARIDAQDLAAEAEEARKQEKGRLIAEIAGRLKGAGLSNAAIEGEIKNRYAHFNNDELRAKVESMDKVKRLRSMSRTELREEAFPRANQAPVLPAEHTRESLLQLTKTNYPAFKALIHRFGSTAVDERLGVVRRRNPGITKGVKF